MRLKTPREHFPRSEAHVGWLGPCGETSGASSEWHVHQLLSEAACPTVLIPRSLCKSLSLPGLGFPPEWLTGQISVHPPPFQELMRWKPPCTWVHPVLSQARPGAAQRSTEGSKAGARPDLPIRFTLPQHLPFLWEKAPPELWEGTPRWVLLLWSAASPRFPSDSEKPMSHSRCSPAPPAGGQPESRAGGRVGALSRTP